MLVDPVIYYARIGATALFAVIVLLIIVIILSMKRGGRDFTWAQLSLNSDAVMRGALAMLAGFVAASSISVSFVIGVPIQGTWEIPFIYAWLMATLYGCVEILGAVRPAKLGKGGMHR